MSKYRKWVLTLGLMAATPGVTLAQPKLPFLKSGRQAQPTRSTSAANNQRIADDIANALRVANISGFDIAIEQRNGTATLSGTVAEARLKTKASEIVARVPGVIRVDNQLQVGGPATGSPDLPNEADFFAAPPVQPVNFEETPPGAFPAENVQTPAPRSTTQDNQAVAQDIADALAQAGLSGFDVEVRYADGTALLAGMVSDPGQRAVAQRAASSVPGVQNVENRLMVQGMPMAAPGPAIAPPQSYHGGAQFGPSPYPSPQPYRGGAQFGPASYQPGPGDQPPMPNGAAPPPYMAGGGPPGAPMPLTYGHPGAGSAESVYNSPNLPEYAWPSYASYPNYAQVNYPQQYSASAWPYIGPFYPYPQVPLGWRQVQLEWDDGSWNLNFRPRTDKWWWFLNPKNW